MPETPATPASITLVQVSDIHLSSRRAYFMPNFEAFLQLMTSLRPDLVIASGDISFDGAGWPDDIAFAASQLARLDVPWRAIPGNHDTGEAPRFARLDQPIGPRRIAAWRSAIGPQWWLQDVGAWRIVAIDTALMASGLAEEKDQQAFVETALAARAGRPVLLFMHMPPFVDDPQDEASTQHAIPFEARGWLIDRCLAGGVRTIACGHNHVYRQVSWRGIDVVWAPTTAFVNVERQLNHGRRFPRAGFVRWTLEGTSLTHTLIEPELMITQDVGRWNEARGSTTSMPDYPLRS